MYNTHLKNKNTNKETITKEASSFLIINDFSPIKWIDGLLLCEIALLNNSFDIPLQKLFKELHSKNRDYHMAMSLNDSEYLFWFEKNKEISLKAIDAGYIEAWAELAELHIKARRPHRNIKYAIESFQKGVEAGDGISMGLYGYHLYYGYFVEQDQKKGKQLLIKSGKHNYDYADTLLLYTDIQSIENKEELFEKIKKYDAETEDKTKVWPIWTEYYLRRENNIPKTIEILEKGVTAGVHNSLFILGTLLLKEETEYTNIERGIQLLKEAYSYRMPNAANFLGNYYEYTTSKRKSEDKAFKWYQKAILYYSEPAALNLSILYSYSKKYKDPTLRLKYLEMAVEDHYHPALLEKAEILLEGNVLDKNPNQAKELLEKAMKLGNNYAPYRLGLAYQNGEFDGERNYEKAYEYYLKAAEKGHVYGYEMVGHYNFVGVLGEPNAEKAIEMFTKAIELNSDYARTKLAFCYEEGFGINQDYKKAFELLTQAAQNNYAYAYYKLGTFHEYGLIDTENLEKAFQNYKKGADLEDPESIYNVGRYYKYGIGIPENPQMALKYFMKGVDYQNLNSYLEMALSHEYEYGELSYDTEKITAYMIVPAENNVPYAQYKMGTYYQYGLTEHNIEKAFDWYTKAYKNNSALAALSLGDYYLYGYGGGEEYDKAFEYYTFAKKHDFISEGIGICYELGFGTEENETEAFKLYRVAADKNYTAAKYRLGLCYKYEIGTPKNLQEAYNWFLPAAEENHTNAQYEVGMLLLTGEGISMNKEKGVDYLMLAAENEYHYAQFELGNCYLSGNGVDENEAKAIYWYEKAAENGNEQAQKVTGRRKRKR